MNFICTFDYHLSDCADRMTQIIDKWKYLFSKSFPTEIPFIKVMFFMLKMKIEIARF